LTCLGGRFVGSSCRGKQQAFNFSSSDQILQDDLNNSVVVLEILRLANEEGNVLLEGGGGSSVGEGSSCVKLLVYVPSCESERYLSEGQLEIESPPRLRQSSSGPVEGTQCKTDGLQVNLQSDQCVLSIKEDDRTKKVSLV
jgi:hypothetical protein